VWGKQLQHYCPRDDLQWQSVHGSLPQVGLSLLALIKPLINWWSVVVLLLSMLLPLQLMQFLHQASRLHSCSTLQLLSRAAAPECLRKLPSSDIYPGCATCPMSLMSWTL
jgi:hypothetical protein